MLRKERKHNYIKHSIKTTVAEKGWKTKIAMKSKDKNGKQ